MAADRVTLLAPAKINLFLAVGGRRSDGYHDVVTILQTLDERVADVVELQAADSLLVTCEPGVGIPAEENLVHRALTRLGEMAGLDPSFSVMIRKRVPAAGGLGGASSDAAAALVGACRLWGLDVTAPEVTKLAASVGADVPFFIGGGTALYTGRGDALIRRLPTPSLELVVVNPGVPVATPAAYAAFERLPGHDAVDPDAMIHAIGAGSASAISAALFNDLGEAAFVVAPEVRDALRWVGESADVLGAIVSGSGSSVFGICENASAACGIADAAAGREGWWASATSASPRGVADIA